jgi:hypothetical protein
MSEIINIAVVTGQVIDNASDTGLSAVNVEAWDAIGVYQQPLASGKTGADGRFTFEIEPAKYNLGAMPDLYFKVLDDSGTELTNTADLITWNAKLQESVTLYIVTDDGSDQGVVDKYNSQELMTMTTFIGQSDFKSVFTEAVGTGTSSLSFVKDMFVNTIGNLQHPPLAVAVNRSDIVGQNQDAATTTLLNQQINVGQVLPYTPGLNTSCLSLLTAQPLNLKAGQTVNLYQQDGVVKFYAIAPGTKQATSSAASCSPGNAELAPGAVMNKDDQIAQLQQQVADMRKEQDALKAFIQSKLPG